MVVVGWSGLMKVINSNSTNLQVIKTCTNVVQTLKDDVRTLVVSEHLGLIATGTTRGVVQVWDFEYLKCTAVF